ncbi:exonuclease domain protein [Bacillus clarus]|uniref:Nuclease SbcCD subunit C n=1 Tax=Bacillus clarus TaxID=2338372 RepID=A0A090YJ62_9BACI|nr:exonuclease domain protein [Bacillus clarus]
MADVIQAYEGGISIETMFIDEGFGSLDEESLTKAVDALIDLQKSGRFIGVISHVQELKNVLEVTKQKDGCSQTRFVVK